MILRAVLLLSGALILPRALLGKIRRILIRFWKMLARVRVYLAVSHFVTNFARTFADTRWVPARILQRMAMASISAPVWATAPSANAVY